MNSTKWSRHAAKALTSTQVASWKELVSRTPAFDSPYFSPEWTQTIAGVMDGIEVGMLHEGDCLVGVFPFERQGRSVAGPVGRDIADYQGPIIAAGTTLDVDQLLCELNLSRFYFDHLPMSEPFRRWCWTTWDSYQVDLREGRQAYLNRLFTRTSNLRRDCGKLGRRVARADGTLRSFISRDEESLFPLMLKWKAEQYESTGRSHPFRLPWVRAALLQSMKSTSGDFDGRMFVLMAGSRPLAIDFGFVNQSVCHMLIASYDPAAARYSPGLLCKLEAIQAGLHDGLQKIDFGKGQSNFKDRLCDASTLLGEGCLDRSSIVGFCRRTLQRSRYRFLQSRFSAPARSVARRIAEVFPRIRTILSMR